ncbi:lysosome membrane protein 2 isoform X1 [Cherax quadricarinatus]|uniref:lysosome membrane protein 2 isoform X1 n=1 Tax=Cherax quadricarinatus TaxID=27406 RepID=UPI00387E2D73
MLMLSENSKTLTSFIKAPVPIYMQIYLFNVTNPDAIRFHGAKPILKEVGPYTYREVREKFDLVWGHDDGSVSYQQNFTFFFDEEMSNGLKETDYITTINAVMVTVAAKIEKLGPAIQAMVELAFLRFKESLFVTRTVGELLFRGYKEPLLNELTKYIGDPTNSKGRFGFFYPVASQVFGNETNPILRTVWSQLEKEMDLFESHVVRELLFEGYPLPEFDFDFSEVLPQLNFTEGWSGTIYEILEAMGVPDIPEFLQDNKMCLMYGRNNSNDGTYKVRTGENGMDNYLNIEEWNGNHTLSYWNSTYCNMINGTDGSQYPPKVTKNTVLRIFTSQLCRSLYLTFEKEISHHGINAYRFTAPEEMLQAADQNPDNACYCYPDQQHCLGSGMLNLQPCAQGANIIMSTPHFYMGDKVELAKLVGLNPNKNDHETFLDVEPRTGVTMKAAKKIQINVPLRPYGNLPSFKNVPEVVFPVLWVNENADVNETLSKEVRKGVSLPFVVVNAICGILIFIGAILLIAGGVKFSRVRNSHGQQKL